MDSSNVKLLIGDDPKILPIAAQVKTKCNKCGRNHEVDYGISTTDPDHGGYEPIENLIKAYEELD